jgi:hypothetical protein
MAFVLNTTNCEEIRGILHPAWSELGQVIRKFKEGGHIVLSLESYEEIRI